MNNYSGDDEAVKELAKSYASGMKTYQKTYPKAKKEADAQYQKYYKTVTGGKGASNLTPVQRARLSVKREKLINGLPKQPQITFGSISDAINKTNGNVQTDMAGVLSIAAPAVSGANAVRYYNAVLSAKGEEAANKIAVTDLNNTVVDRYFKLEELTGNPAGTAGVSLSELENQTPEQYLLGSTKGTFDTVVGTNKQKQRDTLKGLGYKGHEIETSVGLMRGWTGSQDFINELNVGTLADVAFMRALSKAATGPNRVISPTELMGSDEVIAEINSAAVSGKSTEEKVKQVLEAAGVRQQGAEAAQVVATPAKAEEAVQPAAEVAPAQEQQPAAAAGAATPQVGVQQVPAPAVESITPAVVQPLQAPVVPAVQGNLVVKGGKGEALAATLEPANTGKAQPIEPEAQIASEMNTETTDVTPQPGQTNTSSISTAADTAKNVTMTAFLGVNIVNVVDAVKSMVPSGVELEEGSVLSALNNCVLTAADIMGGKTTETKLADMIVEALVKAGVVKMNLASGNAANDIMTEDLALAAGDGIPMDLGKLRELLENSGKTYKYGVFTEEQLGNIGVLTNSAAAYMIKDGAGHVVIVKGVEEGMVKYQETTGEKKENTVSVKEFMDMGFSGMMMVEKGDYETLATKKAVTPEMELPEVAKKLGINEGTVKRLSEEGYPIDKAIDLVVNGVMEPGQINEAFVLSLGASKGYNQMFGLIGAKEGETNIQTLVDKTAGKLNEVRMMGEKGQITALEGKALMNIYAMTRDILIAVAKEQNPEEKEKMIKMLNEPDLMTNTSGIVYLQNKIVLSKAVNRNAVIAAAGESGNVKEFVKGSEEDFEINMNAVKKKLEEKQSFMAQVFGNTANITDAFPAAAIERMKEGERGVIVSALLSKAITQAA